MLKHALILLAAASFLLGCEKLSSVTRQAGARMLPIRNGHMIPPQLLPAVQLLTRRENLADPATWGYCTATAISPRVVLTAAHCVVDSFTDPAKVLFGASGPGAVNGIPAVQITIHEAYSRAFSFPVDSSGRVHAGSSVDIALIHLDRDVPGPYPTYGLSEDLPEGTNLLAIGFGLPLFGRKQVGVFELNRYADAILPGINRGPTRNARVPAGYLIGVAGRSRQLICRGDSGGPDLVMLGDRPDIVSINKGANRAECDDALSETVHVALAPFRSRIREQVLYNRLPPSNDRFLRRAYRLVLGRGPDAEFPERLARLSNGAPPTAIARDLFDAPERLTRVISDYFLFFFGRAPEVAELAEALRLYRESDDTAVSVIRSLVLSSEYAHQAKKVYQGYPQKVAYLALLYRDLLDVPLTREEVKSLWKDVWKGVKQEEIVDALLGGEEYRAGRIAQLYSLYLGRPPLMVEMKFWADKMVEGMRLEDVAVALLSSPEFLFSRPGQIVR